MTDDARAVVPLWLAILFATICSVMAIWMTQSVGDIVRHYVDRDQACDAWCYDHRRYMTHKDYMECFERCDEWKH